MKILFYILAGMVVLLSLFLAIRTDIIRDISNSEKKPYSLSRTQLLWWTTIVLSCFIIYYACYETLSVLNNETLTLLGISVSTTVSGSIIDNTEIKQNALRHQDKLSGGFFYDLLSDGNGLSIHRFQNLVFTILFGMVFLMEFFKTYTFYSFSSQELILMGISSSTYIVIRYSENASDKSSKILNSNKYK